MKKIAMPSDTDIEALADYIADNHAEFYKGRETHSVAFVAMELIHRLQEKVGNQVAIEPLVAHDIRPSDPMPDFSGAEFEEDVIYTLPEQPCVLDLMAKPRKRDSLGTVINDPNGGRR